MSTVFYPLWWLNQPSNESASVILSLIQAKLTARSLLLWLLLAIKCTFSVINLESPNWICLVKLLQVLVLLRGLWEARKCHGHERQIEFDSLSPRQSTQLSHGHRVNDISSMIKEINHPKMTILASFTLMVFQTRMTKEDCFVFLI